MDFDGTISVVFGRCPDLFVTISGQTVVTDSSTDFHKSKCDDVKEGRSASGTGVVVPGGAIRATEFEAGKKDKDKD